MCYYIHSIKSKYCCKGNVFTDSNQRTLFLILNDFREVNSLKNKNKKELNDDMLKNLDKSTVEKKMKELEELIEEIKERELQKTTDENRKKAILNAYNKAINGLNEAKEKIENSME